VSIIKVSKLNEVYAYIHCDKGEGMEISEHFTFMVPGYKFMPAYRNKIWDGKIRLYHSYNQTLYYGLIPYLKKFCDDRGYTFEVDRSVDADEDFSVEEAREFIKTLQMKLDPRDYQVDAFVHAIRKRRAMMLSPTASGKSLIIYLVTRFLDGKTLIIVPTTSLVSQLEKDFYEYGYDSQKYVHPIMSGADKNTDKPVVISTWQSIYKQKKDWFDQFDVVIGDEAHQFKAKSLTTIMTNLDGCSYRYGFTGTLDGTQTHKLVLEGLFGQVEKVTTTKTLMDQGNLAEFKIKSLILKHTKENCKLVSKYKYQEEIDYLVSSQSRNKFITNLTLSLGGNTLLLFQYVDKHGKMLYNTICEKVDKNRKVFYVSGETKASVREDIRGIVESESNSIIVASFGTFSTGINIRNLHNVIFASPSKSKVRTLQSIGRGLRLGDNKEYATLYDIADDLTHGKKQNYTLQHFVERMKIYNEEKFDYKMYQIQLKG
jgi:superfamily II DNA or RNA helicase